MMIINSKCTLIYLITMTFICMVKSNKRYPIILLSGYMGNQMWYTMKDSDSYVRKPLWLDGISAYLTPECWQHKMMLHYDAKLHISFSNKGVFISTEQFGTTNGVDYIAAFPQQNRISEYYALLIRSLELHAGYKRNRDIFGAPYDWRKSPHEQPEFFERLRQLVERAYFVNNNTPVILLGHSMGGNFIYIFLRKQKPEWKKKFVRTTFFMAVPWGGNLKYMYSYLYNDDFAGNILPMFREIERNFPSLSFLLPNRRVFGDDVLLETPNSKYTTHNLDKLMLKLGRPKVIPMWKDTRNLMDPFVHPGTDIVCVVGIGFNTMRKVVLTEDAYIDGEHRKRLRRRRSIRLRRRKAFRENKLSSLNQTKLNELYQSIFNSTSFYNDASLPKINVINNIRRNMLKNRTISYSNDISSLEGKPRNKKTTKNIIDLFGGLGSRMFKDFFNIGDQLTRGFFDIFPFGLGNIRSIRDNIFNSKRFHYYWHVIENILNPQLPNNAYDTKNGRFVFFSEGDSFVNIESGLKCLDWYSNSPKAKHEFYFDLINDSHLGMLRNKKSVEYFTRLIKAIR